MKHAISISILFSIIGCASESPPPSVANPTVTAAPKLNVAPSPSDLLRFSGEYSRGCAPHLNDHVINFGEFKGKLHCTLVSLKIFEDGTIEEYVFRAFSDGLPKYTEKMKIISIDGDVATLKDNSTYRGLFLKDTKLKIENRDGIKLLSTIGRSVDTSTIEFFDFVSASFIPIEAVNNGYYTEKVGGVSPNSRSYILKNEEPVNLKNNSEACRKFPALCVE